MIRLSGEHGAVLAAKSRALNGAALALVELHESYPDMAASAGVEVPALEVRGLLASGAAGRVQNSIASGRQPSIEDMEALSRMEGVLNVADSRIAVFMGQLESHEASAPIEKLSGIMGLATGVMSLVRSVF